MKKIFKPLFILSIFILMILNPQIILTGAKNGIILWYKGILPSLLPYMIISNLMIMSGVSDSLSILTKPFTRLLRVSDSSSFAIISGILFGYPACAASCIALYQKGQTDSKTATLITSCFNNISPAFISGYVCMEILNDVSLIPKILVLFYISLLLSTIVIRLTVFHDYAKPHTQKISVYKSSGNLFDNAIMSAITNIIKLCGYIVIFSIVAGIITKLPLKYNSIVCALIEITTGLNAMNSTIANKILLIVLILSALSFGGISGIFQTFGIDTEGIIDRKKYIYSKITALAISLLTGYLAVYVLKIIE